MPSEMLVELPLLAVLLGLSAFFSGSETAFFSLPQTLYAEMKVSRHATHRRVAYLLDHKKDLLITILFGNMVVNVLFFSLTYAMSTHLYEAGWERVAPFVSVIGVVLVVVFGEVSPKAVAVHFPRRISLFAVHPVYFAYLILTPIRRVFGRIVDLITGAAIRKGGHPHDFTNDQMRTVLELGHRHGALRPDQAVMMSEVLDMSEIEVREIMEPRVELPMFDLADPRDDLVELVRQERPKVVVTYAESIDRTAGVIHAKDVFLFPEKEPGELVRKVPYVPESKPLDELLRELREAEQSIAIVVDEYGGTEGLVTVEHLVEEIVGEIKQEYEEEEEDVIPLGKGVWSIDGGLSVHDLEDLLGIDVESDEFATLAGFVLYLAGRFPREGETLDDQGFAFTVLRIRKHRVERVRIERLHDEESEEDGR